MSSIVEKHNGYKHLVSVVILTHNSFAKLEECLESVKWSDDIVIVDDYSTDNTLDIARKYTDRIYIRKWENEGVHRNFAYSLAKCDYILSLDSDERVTPELREEILQLMKDGFTYDCYNIPHRNYLGTYWVRYGGWYPNAKLKLFKKKLPIYKEEEYHPPAVIMGERFTLKGELVHLAYKDYSDLMCKVDHQTNFEAKKWFRDKRKINTCICIRKATDRFIKGFILKRGYKDGLIGFMLALSSFIYQILTYAKYRELKRLCS